METALEHRYKQVADGFFGQDGLGMLSDVFLLAVTGKVLQI